MKINIFFLTLFLSCLFVSCDNDDPTPVIIEKINPGSIAQDNLIAYFAFEGEPTDSIQALVPAQQKNVAYVGGRRGKAYQGGNGTYLLYSFDENNPLAQIETGFTVATWIRGPKVTTALYPKILELTKKDNNNYGNLSWTQENLVASKDEMFFKWQFNANDKEQWVNQPLKTSEAFASVRWQHIIISYGNADSLNVYVNGASVDTLSTKYNDLHLSFSNTEELLIGGWVPQVKGGTVESWMGWFEGALDELRIYNKGLSREEAIKLYEAEMTQVN